MPRPTSPQNTERAAIRRVMTFYLGLPKPADGEPGYRLALLQGLLKHVGIESHIVERQMRVCKRFKSLSKTTRLGKYRALRILGSGKTFYFDRDGRRGGAAMLRGAEGRERTMDSALESSIKAEWRSEWTPIHYLTPCPKTLLDETISAMDASFIRENTAVAPSRRTAVRRF